MLSAETSTMMISGRFCGKTPDRERAHVLLEQAAKGLDAHRLSLGLENDFRVDFLGHGNRVEIDVNDLAAHGMVLDFLDEREAIAWSCLHHVISSSTRMFSPTARDEDVSRVSFRSTSRFVAASLAP